jgi:alkylation response protein AidB-like acyl-CoA dehydrogenase
MARDSNDADPLRDEVHAWLDEHWDPDLTVDEWWRMVGRAGWTAPHFPVDQGGRGLHRTAGNTVRAAFAEYGALRPPGGLGLLMAAPTILTHGTPEQIARHVPPILEGQFNWCQLFSEPGFGSDLAGLSTRATRDGDRWIISGQKVWSSMARECDHGMLLARTDFDVPKHAGISWFAFKLDQPGVTIRPLREMTGEAVFNEVFFDDAEVDDADLIGGGGKGWAVTQTTLFYERSGIGAGGAHAGFPVPGPKGNFLGRRAGDAARDREPGGNLIVQFADLARLATSQQRNRDSHIRQELARLYSYSKIGQWNAQRAKAEAKKGGGQTIANLGKIAQTRIVKSAARIGTEILGADAMLATPNGVEDGRFSAAMVFSPASSIYGGSDEIQRNIVAEKGLGLPKDELPGKGQPYGEFLRQLAPSA